MISDKVTSQASAVRDRRAQTGRMRAGGVATAAGALVIIAIAACAGEDDDSLRSANSGLSEEEVLALDEVQEALDHRGCIAADVGHPKNPDQPSGWVVVGDPDDKIVYTFGAEQPNGNSGSQNFKIEALCRCGESGGGNGGGGSGGGHGGGHGDDHDDVGQSGGDDDDGGDGDDLIDGIDPDTCQKKYLTVHVDLGDDTDGDGDDSGDDDDDVVVVVPPDDDDHEDDDVDTDEPPDSGDCSDGGEYDYNFWVDDCDAIIDVDCDGEADILVTVNADGTAVDMDTDGTPEQTYAPGEDVTLDVDGDGDVDWTIFNYVDGDCSIDTDHDGDPDVDDDGEPVDDDDGDDVGDPVDDCDCPLPTDVDGDGTPDVTAHVSETDNGYVIAADPYPTITIEYTDTGATFDLDDDGDAEQEIIAGELHIDTDNDGAYDSVEAIDEGVWLDVNGDGTDDILVIVMDDECLFDLEGDLIFECGDGSTDDDDDDNPPCVDHEDDGDIDDCPGNPGDDDGGDDDTTTVCYTGTDGPACHDDPGTAVVQCTWIVISTLANGASFAAAMEMMGDGPGNVDPQGAPTCPDCISLAVVKAAQELRGCTQIEQAADYLAGALPPAIVEAIESYDLEALSATPFGSQIIGLLEAAAGDCPGIVQKYRTCFDDRYELNPEGGNEERCGALFYSECNGSVCAPPFGPCSSKILDHEHFRGFDDRDRYYRWEGWSYSGRVFQQKIWKYISPFKGGDSVDDETRRVRYPMSQSGKIWVNVCLPFDEDVVDWGAVNFDARPFPMTGIYFDMFDIPSGASRIGGVISEDTGGHP